MTYRVIVTPRAEQQINELATYIAREKQEPINAAKVLQAIWDAVPTLAEFPDRGPLAPEDALCDHTVRMLIIKKTLLLLYWVDEQQRAVYVEAFRHAARMPFSDL